MEMFVWTWLLTWLAYHAEESIIVADKYNLYNKILYLLQGK